MKEKLHTEDNFTMWYAGYRLDINIQEEIIYIPKEPFELKTIIPEKFLNLEIKNETN
jgi:hypothetical protein